MTKDAIEFIEKVNKSVDLLEKFNTLATNMNNDYPSLLAQIMVDENKNDSIWIEAELRFKKAVATTREILR